MLTRVKLEKISGQKQAGWNRRVGLRRECDQNLQVLLNINVSDGCTFVIQVCLIPSGPVDLARPNLSVCKVQFHFLVFSLKKKNNKKTKPSPQPHPQGSISLLPVYHTSCTKRSAADKQALATD